MKKSKSPVRMWSKISQRQLRNKSNLTKKVLKSISNRKRQNKF